jgi:hypothetical protein
MRHLSQDGALVGHVLYLLGLNKRRLVQDLRRTVGKQTIGEWPATQAAGVKLIVLQLIVDNVRL